MNIFPQTKIEPSDIPTPRKAGLSLDRLIEYRYRVRRGEYTDFCLYTPDVRNWQWADDNARTCKGDLR